MSGTAWIRARASRERLGEVPPRANERAVDAAATRPLCGRAPDQEDAPIRRDLRALCPQAARRAWRESRRESRGAATPRSPRGAARGSSPACLRRVEGVPLKLSRRAELLEGLHAHDLNALGPLGLTGERERMEEQRAVPRPAQAERLQPFKEVDRLRRRCPRRALPRRPRRGPASRRTRGARALDQRWATSARTLCFSDLLAASTAVGS